MELTARERRTIALAVFGALAMGLWGCATTPAEQGVISYDTSNLYEMTLLTAGLDGSEFAPAISPDGEWLYYSGKDRTSGSDYDIYRVRAQGGHERMKITDRSENDLHPSVFPDGDEILFIGESGKDWIIYHCELGSQWKPRRLPVVIPGMDVDAPRHVTVARMSPKRSEPYVVFESTDKPRGFPGLSKKRFRLSNNNSIWVQNVDEDKILRKVCEGRFPTWHPDGTRIAFSQVIGDRSELHVIDRETGDEWIITKGPDAMDACPSWSPDGNWLVFARLQNGTWDLWKVRANGTALLQLTNAKDSNEFNPAWGIGGRIFFQSDAGGNLGIWRLQLIP